MTKRQMDICDSKVTNTTEKALIQSVNFAISLVSTLHFDVIVSTCDILSTVNFANLITCSLYLSETRKK